MDERIEVVTATGKTLPEFGNFHENRSAFERALYKIDNGEQDFGAQIIKTLLDHILRTKESKSTMWLLPEIYAALGKLGIEAQDLPQGIRVPTNGVVEIHTPLDDIREQLTADILQFQAEAEQKAATLSVIDNFFWQKGIEDCLESARQRLYARFRCGDSISSSG